MTPWLILAPMTALYAGGAYFLKLYAMSASPLWLAPSFALYLTGNLLYALILRETDLGVAAMASSLAGVVLAALIGRVFLGETLSLVQLIGMAFGLVAMALVLAPVAR